MKYRALTLSVALVAGLGVAGGVAMTSASADSSCPSVQLLGVPGTAYYLTWNNGMPNGIDPNIPGAMITQVADALGAERADGEIGYEQVVQPADVGVVVPYRESTRIGAELVRNRIADIANRCGDTKFAIVGYSQGAAVAGDVLADIGQGRGPIPADRVSTGGLLSDPRRSAADQLVGPVVPGVGVDGERPGGFGAVQDRTVTFCAGGDIVCDTDVTNTVLRPIVRKVADRANVGLVDAALEALRTNELDPQKWAEYFEAPDPITLAGRIALTVRDVESYMRVGNHAFYNDMRLNVDGRTATQALADRVRADLDHADSDTGIVAAPAGRPLTAPGDPAVDAAVVGFGQFRTAMSAVSGGRSFADIVSTTVPVPEEALTTLLTNAIVRKDPNAAPEVIAKSLAAAAEIGDIMLAVDPNDLATFSRGLAQASAAIAALQTAPTPEAVLAAMQGAGLLTSSGLDILGDVLRMYEASANIPQVADMLAMVDPNSPEGGALFAQLPVQAQTPQLRSGLVAMAEFGRTLNKVDKYQIIGLAKEYADLAAKGDPMGLLRLPDLMLRSMNLAGDTIRLLAGTDLAALGSALQAGRA